MNEIPGPRQSNVERDPQSKRLTVTAGAFDWNGSKPGKHLDEKTLRTKGLPTVMTSPRYVSLRNGPQLRIASVQADGTAPVHFVPQGIDYRDGTTEREVLGRMVVLKPNPEGNGTYNAHLVTEQTTTVNFAQGEIVVAFRDWVHTPETLGFTQENNQTVPVADVDAGHGSEALAASIQSSLTQAGIFTNTVSDRDIPNGQYFTRHIYAVIAEQPQQPFTRGEDLPEEDAPIDIPKELLGKFAEIPSPVDHEIKEYTLAGMHIATGVDKGKRKHRQEDMVGATEITLPNGEKRALLYAIDGMGGQMSGDKASGIITNTLEQAYAYFVAQGDESGEALKKSLQIANERIIQTVYGAGATMTAAVVDKNGHVLLARFGDARAYDIRPGFPPSRLALDQSGVEELVTLGELTDEGRYQHPHRNLVANNLGTITALSELEETIPYNHQLSMTQLLGEFTLPPDATLLLCSDGLWEMVRDPQLGEIVSSGSSPKEIVETLLTTANNNGGEDNIGVALLRFSASQ